MNTKKDVKIFLVGFTNIDLGDKIICTINKDNNDVSVDKTAIIDGREARKLYNAIERLSNRRIKKNKK